MDDLLAEKLSTGPVVWYWSLSETAWRAQHLAAKPGGILHVNGCTVMLLACNPTRHLHDVGAAISALEGAIRSGHAGGSRGESSTAGRDRSGLKEVLLHAAELRSNLGKRKRAADGKEDEREAKRARWADVDVIDLT